MIFLFPGFGVTVKKAISFVKREFGREEVYSRKVLEFFQPPKNTRTCGEPQMVATGPV